MKGDHQYARRLIYRQIDKLREEMTQQNNSQETSDTSGHTPLPWGTEVTNSGLWIGPMRADGMKVADIVVSFEHGDEYNDCFNEQQRANAALIVEAANSHAALLAERGALKVLAKELSNALLKVRPLGGSELFVQRCGEYYADPRFCGDQIEQLRAENFELTKAKYRSFTSGKRGDVA